jgi:hypothetical protein
MVHVASSQRSRGDDAEDGRVNATGCTRLFYPNFAIFIVLGHDGICLLVGPINRTLGGWGSSTLLLVSFCIS